MTRQHKAFVAEVVVVVALVAAIITILLVLTGCEIPLRRTECNCVPPHVAKAVQDRFPQESWHPVGHPMIYAY